MKKYFLILGFMLFSIPMFSQLTIKDLSYNVDGLQLVKQFYEENIDSIDSYNDKYSVGLEYYDTVNYSKGKDRILNDF